MPRTAHEIIGWVRDWCRANRLRVARGEQVQTLPLRGALAELAEVVGSHAAAPFGRAIACAENAGVSVSRIDEFSAVFEAAAASLPQPAPALPTYFGQDGKPYAVRVLPNCIALTGPDGVSKFVWHDATGRLKADPQPPRGG